MPHISKKSLDEGIRAKLFDQLFEAFKTAGRKGKTSLILVELFTPTEKMMFAKRLAMVLLLEKGIPQHLICEYLQVSPSTVARISSEVDRGKYKKIISMAGNRLENIVSILIKLIFFSMPPRVGRGRWKNLNNLFD